MAGNPENRSEGFRKGEARPPPGSFGPQKPGKRGSEARKGPGNPDRPLPRLGEKPSGPRERAPRYYVCSRWSARQTMAPPPPFSPLYDLAIAVEAKSLEGTSRKAPGFSPGRGRTRKGHPERVLESCPRPFRAQRVGERLSPWLKPWALQQHPFRMQNSSLAIAREEGEWIENPRSLFRQSNLRNRIRAPLRTSFP